MIYWGRKLVLIFLLMIYLSVSLNFVMVYTAHLLHHVVTNTLDQHDHGHDHYAMDSHFSGDHDHDHSHSHAIDHAIREVKHEDQHHETQSPPAPRLEIKFPVHHLPSKTAGTPSGLLYKDIVYPYIVNYKSPILLLSTPPPKPPF